VSPYSSGTFVDAEGKAHHLTANEFTLTPGGDWTSAASKATYPLTWHLEVPSLGITLSETTKLKTQELFSPHSISPGYWEGAVDYQGAERGAIIRGRGYLEMTGYLAPLRLGH
jgi:predicted secreted hydrolase